MKSNLIIYSLVFCAIIALVNCTKPLDIELESAPPKLVISSQVIPSSFMIVTISRSFSALAFSEDNGDTTSQELLNNLLVNNAFVTISYDGIIDTLFHDSNFPGVYVSFQTPIFTNTSYNLYVYDSLTKEEVTSQATMLRQVQFDSVEAKFEKFQDLTDIKVKFSFTDPANEENWYMVNFYKFNNDSLQSNDPFLEDSTSNETLLISDKTFNNQVYQGEYNLFNWTNDTIFVSISNISKPYFEYLDARKKSGTLFTNLVKEPINYPTNINGGYGFFNAHFPDVAIVEVE